MRQKFITISLLILTICTFGCAAPGHIKAGDPSLISVGMTKEEVIQKLGRPETVTADDKSETLNYVLERPWWQDQQFCVKIVKGKVVSYDTFRR